MKRVAAVALGVGFWAVSAWAGQVGLIQEIERLRNSLPPRDASRGELALRLADLYFFEGADLAKQADLAPEDPQSAAHRARSQQYRTQALGLYREQAAALAPGERRVKIDFQMARLNQDLGRMGEAKQLWRDLAAQSLVSSIRNEAVLRLGEIAEEEGTPASLKDAEKYYGQVVRECVAGDLCPYVKFRLAWLLRHQGRIADAIPVMRDSLRDAKGGIREDSLRDLIVFHTAQPTDGEAALVEIEALSTQLNRPELIAQLADGFFSNGNKGAGVRVLEFLDARDPTFAQKVRLLEELYGQRQWDRFRSTFAAALGSPTDKESAEDLDRSEKIIRRLVVQLDGERISDPQYLPDFQGTVALYLKVFPRTPDSYKLMEGWLASQPDGERKEAQIAAWLKDPAFALKPEQALRLHEIRIASAQKGKRLDVVVEEAAALAALVAAEPKRREYRYARARALYEQKAMDAALEGFQQLAQPVGEPDRWAVLSQNLSLDILASRKDYAGTQRQAALWLEAAPLRANAALASELSDMQKVKDQAAFEGAVAQGQSPQALATFHQFCRTERADAKFKEKSCANAKVLAVQLKDSAVLIELLRAEGNRVAVANEQEAAGLFADAARTWEEQLPLAAGKWTSTDALKIALLYELGEKKHDQTRWLKALAASLQRAKAVTPSESWVYQTLDDAQLLDAAAMRLPWTPATQLRLAHALESRGQGTPQTHRLLLDSKVSLGTAWSKKILARAAELADAQKKVSFYGKNSRVKFQSRVNALQNVDRFAVPYLDGADVPTRVALLSMLRKGYEDFAAEIGATPLPAGLDEESQAQLRASLAEMAAPFQAKSADYARLGTEQAARLPSAVGQTDSIKTVVAAPVADPWPLVRAHPTDAAQFDELQKRFAARGEHRLASYFEGRKKL